jgi:acyl-CoA synthetase (AMP-forming)/AMP-acid ligase II
VDASDGGGGKRAEPDERVAYVMAASGRRVTYDELEHDSRRIAQLFHRRGLRFDDHLAMVLTNNEWVFKVALAAQRSGLVYTAVNYHLTAEEAAYIVADSDARAVVVDAALGPVARELAALLPERVESRLVVGGAVPGYEDLATAIAELPATPLEEELEGSPMLYSSGTTGRPKGVNYAHPRLPYPSPATLHAGIVALYGMSPATVYLSPAPLYHSAPLNFNLALLRAGGTTVVMERFDPEDFLALVERHRVTLTQVVPTMFVRLLKLPGETRTRYDLSSLQRVVHAAAPCPVAVKQQMIAWWGPIVDEYYAATENVGSSFITSEEWLAHPGSVGRPVGATVHVVGEDGGKVPVGEAGVIWFERPGDAPRFRYHNDDEKTAAVYDEHGWTSVGDMGYLDDEGYLYLTDRRDFVVVSGGVNIYPQEAENLLVTHPKVMDAAVFGVPNAEMGEEVKAIVQPVDWDDAGAAFEQELIEFCRTHLARYKCPRTVDFERELPRQATGKLYKRLLRDRYWTGRSSRIV